MTDQPPSDPKPRRRSAPRKRVPAKRAAKKAAPPQAVDQGEAATAPIATQRRPSREAPAAPKAAPPDARVAAPSRDAGDAHGAVDDAAPPRPARIDPVVIPATGAAVTPSQSAPTAESHAAAVARAPQPPQEPVPSAVHDAGQAAPSMPAPAIRRQDDLRPGELIRVPLSVRWRDLDAFNHVNNSKYLSYLEEARLRWMLSVPGMGMDENVAPVVAASNLNYRRPIEWPGEVVVELFVERLGGSSLTVGHRIVSSTDGSVLYCDGNVVMVWIDRTTGRSAPLPEGVRAACR